jgi:hypothetical protein
VPEHNVFWMRSPIKQSVRGTGPAIVTRARFMNAASGAANRPQLDDTVPLLGADAHAPRLLERGGRRVNARTRGRIAGTGVNANAQRPGAVPRTG